MDNDQKEQVKIIVVDDSDFSRKGMVDILTSEGFAVIGEANSAEFAMQIIASSKDCDMVIIDVVMPEISGIELAGQINEKFEDVSIMMVSSLDMESVIIESISKGAIDFLRKPFEKEDLIKSVNKIASNIQSNL